MQARVAFNSDSSLLATASSKGTVIRVHHLPEVHSILDLSCKFPPIPEFLTSVLIDSANTPSFHASFTK